MNSGTTIVPIAGSIFVDGINIIFSFLFKCEVSLGLKDAFHHASFKFLKGFMSGIDLRSIKGLSEPIDITIWNIL